MLPRLLLGLLLLLLTTTTPAPAFDIASPIAAAVGSVASYSINKLVIDPQRERAVFKVWKELRESEMKEAREQGLGGTGGAASSSSLLPETIVARNRERTRLSYGEQEPISLSSYTPEGSRLLHGEMSGGSLQGVTAFDGPGGRGGRGAVVDPRFAIVTDRCNATGVLTLLFDQFTPKVRLPSARAPPFRTPSDLLSLSLSPCHHHHHHQGRVDVYRSRSAALDARNPVRLPFDRRHKCGGTALDLAGAMGVHPTKDTVRLFSSASADRQGRAAMESFLRDLRACDHFAYQAIDASSCKVSNVVVLSQSTPFVPAKEIETVQRSNPYVGRAREIDLTSG